MRRTMIGLLFLCSLGCEASEEAGDETAAAEQATAGAGENLLEEEEEAAPASAGRTEEEAITLARAAAEEEYGERLGEYPEVSASRSESGDGWFVIFEMAAPTPPGGHFGVFIGDDGETRVHPGE